VDLAAASSAADAVARQDARLRRVVLVVGWIFVVASLPKFLAYGWELRNFERFGLPVAPVWVTAAGVLELAGGALLVRGRLVVPVAIVLAAVMLVAIAVSGVAQGDVVPSLTVAPALLAALLFVIVQTVPRKA
jgi:uncharacterized membrane protein YphA (DoxX/SURF4 family)